MLRLLLGIIVLFSMAPVAGAAGFDHQDWNDLLVKYVVSINDGKATEVDYQGLANERQKLQAYLNSVAEVDQKSFQTWTQNDQLAFLINAYNGWTVELILSKYPDLKSIKDLGSFLKSPWKKKFIPLLGIIRSLDDIEHGLIRAPESYDEPRIHFAVNCASIGCPALRPEAYRGDILESQLQSAEMLFLGDKSRNRLVNNVFEISSIFKWYGDDFRKGNRGIESLEQYLLSHSGLFGLSEEQKTSMQNGKMKIRYLKYDWKLNSLRSVN